ncbi:hypothetical protein JG687_00018904 [Phytophthora cactorum]|uniref:Uncharacterized protein n=1 Tax=Phytophthora cactorum TaxID=29920 RepID=A0A8T1TKP0_9STRA|nr:hypothetical protein GQ600_4329 [Phytophthora cactorum]KAG6942707.1 hypothetical protein JG687_00018904 [Phytophthora cactorum]
MRVVQRTRGERNGGVTYKIHEPTTCMCHRYAAALGYANTQVGEVMDATFEEKIPERQSKHPHKQKISSQICLCSIRMEW